MKNCASIPTFLCAAGLLLSCGENGASAAPGPEFALGADISWVTELESGGHRFFNADGVETDCFRLMKELGLNAVRLRVWVDPSEHGSWCNADDLLEKARRAAAEGLDIMVDFHYSDWWADPAKQTVPAAWQSHSFTQLKEDVRARTTDVLRRLKKGRISPKWIQIGNETSDGFLWDAGRAGANPAQYAELFAAGHDAAKSVFPKAGVIVHLDNGFDNELYNWNLDILKEHGARWDIVGMSLYPYWAVSSGREPDAGTTISDCLSVIRNVGEKYGCDVMIVETGMECADDSGRLAPQSVLEEGREQLRRILRECRNLPGGRCAGVFYWEPECRPSQYRLGAFTEDGRPTAIMDAFLEF
ncbi:MAG: arabinogalactan endo-1,4-beta-galactosidase [Treponemataceae bacterium]|nr:arabinogalactan endo-1,4-beta-galactosidase [Treponemataceae bacterium]